MLVKRSADATAVAAVVVGKACRVGGGSESGVGSHDAVFK